MPESPVFKRGEWLNKAIEVNPKDAEAYYSRGNVYYNQQKWDLAKADFTKSAELYQAQGDTATYQKVMVILQKLSKYI